jgi:16S rRNA (guanine966-N2)-methyltransferase
VTRIITGHAKGRRLQTPGGDATRPTGARVKQTLFDILSPRLGGCRFLDAFAGSGGIGFEALSRGASRVVLVDTAAAAVAALRANAELVSGAGGLARIFRQDALVALPALASAGERFDVVYVDPPYASDLYEPAIAACEALLAEGGVVIAEHFHKRALPETIGRLARSREVRIGDHRLSFFARSETA